MAEAVVDGTPMSRFYCHMCDVEIERLLPDYTCPTCASGFIEELEGGNNDVNAATNVPADDSIDVEVDLQGHYLSQQQDLMDIVLGLTNPGLGAPVTNTNNARGARRGTNVWSRGSQDPRRSNSNRGRQEGMIYREVIEDFILNVSGLNHPVSQDGPPPVLFLGNPGDYVWGRDGLDTIVTQLLNQMDGTGPPPLSQKQIDEIPTTTVSASHVECKLQCSVCWDDFMLSEPVKQLPCQHVYHAPCIVPWLELHGTCPICRQSLGDQNSADANRDTVGPSLAALFRAANNSRRASPLPSSPSSSLTSSPSTSSAESNTSNNSTSEISD
ncbi:hypothetical protein KM043_000210 [Ampulex compressa]|nr:hypothetical protein KM043_000210 [Ampulex compressa]